MKRYLAIAALLAAAAACARDGSPVAAVPPRLTTGVDSQLSLILGGPNKVLTAPKLVTYKITPSGGTAPYSYHWLVEVCHTDGSCSSHPYLVRVGAQDTLQESFTSDITTYTVTVEATDANGITGATDVQTLGPGVFEAAGGVGFCDGGANYFPFQDSGNTPDSTKPYYARNPCTGSRIWNSTTFGSPDPRTP